MAGSVLYVVQWVTSRGPVSRVRKWQFGEVTSLALGPQLASSKARIRIQAITYYIPLKI